MTLGSPVLLLLVVVWQASATRQVSPFQRLLQQRHLLHPLVPARTQGWSAVWLQQLAAS
jgi:hypothetical protein